MQVNSNVLLCKHHEHMSSNRNPTSDSIYLYYYSYIYSLWLQKNIHKFNFLFHGKSLRPIPSALFVLLFLFQSSTSSNFKLKSIFPKVHVWLPIELFENNKRHKVGTKRLQIHSKILIVHMTHSKLWKLYFWFS